MINYVMVGTNRFDDAVAFYGALLGAMGATQVYAAEQSVAWGWGVGTAMFIVTRPFDRQQATRGNGCMVAFDVESAASRQRGRPSPSAPSRHRAALLFRARAPTP